MVIATREITATKNTARHESIPEVLHQFTVQPVDVNARQLQYTILRPKIPGRRPDLDRETETESIAALIEAGPVSPPNTDRITEGIGPLLGSGRMPGAHYWSIVLTET